MTKPLVFDLAILHNRISVGKSGVIMFIYLAAGGNDSTRDNPQDEAYPHL